MTTKKKKAEAPKEPVRKIYRDFTLEEFDVFTMDLQSEGAMHERGSIIEELKRRRNHIYDLMTAMPSGNEDSVKLVGYFVGLQVAIGYIEKMPAYEDRCGCVECGAI